MKSTHCRGWNGANIRAEHGLTAGGGSRTLIVRAAIASYGSAGIVCAMLMLHHASVNIVRMRTANDATAYLRFGNLRRPGEGEDCGDYARNTDAMADHV